MCDDDGVCLCWYFVLICVNVWCCEIEMLLCVCWGMMIFWMCMMMRCVVWEWWIWWCCEWRFESFWWNLMFWWCFFRCFWVWIWICLGSLWWGIIRISGVWWKMGCMWWWIIFFGVRRRWRVRASGRRCGRETRVWVWVGFWCDCCWCWWWIDMLEGCWIVWWFWWEICVVRWTRRRIRAGSC